MGNNARIKSQPAIFFVIVFPSRSIELFFSFLFFFSSSFFFFYPFVESRSEKRRTKSKSKLMSVTPHLPATWGCLHVRCMHFWSGSSLFPCLYPAAIILSPSPPLPLLSLSREKFTARLLSTIFIGSVRTDVIPLLFFHTPPPPRLSSISSFLRAREQGQF